MKQGAKISIIIPVYNVESYLPFSIESCINQTLKDIEIICINDGSTDSSLEILQTYAKIDNRIIVIDKENGGVSTARNAGIRASTGKWIMFLDPDDYYEENACERVWIESEEGKTDIINFGTNVFPHYPKATAWHYFALSVWTKRYYSFHPDILFREPSSKPFLWHQAFSRELLEKSNVEFDKELKFGEDMAFLIDIYPHATNFAFIEDKLYNYRWIRKNSIMQTAKKDPDKKIQQHLLVVEKILEYWEKYDFIKKYGDYILFWALEFIVSGLNTEDLTKDNRNGYAKELHDILKKYNLLEFKSSLDKNGMRYYNAIKSV